MAITRNTPCPCGSGRKTKACCGQYLDGEPAPTAVALMRSRWTAYATGDAAYVQRTTHPESRHYDPDPRRWLKDLREFCTETRFVALTVLREELDGDVAWVTFHAELRRGLENASFDERSRFVREGGRWWYVEGE